MDRKAILLHYTTRRLINQRMLIDRYFPLAGVHTVLFSGYFISLVQSVLKLRDQCHNTQCIMSCVTRDLYSSVQLMLQLGGATVCTNITSLRVCVLTAFPTGRYSRGPVRGSPDPRKWQGHCDVALCVYRSQSPHWVLTTFE